jgi:hypothetical protein
VLATPPYGLRSLGVGSQGPHTNGRGLRSSDAKKRQEGLLSFKPGSRERKTEALEASPIKLRDPQTPVANGLDRHHRAELQHRAPNFCLLWSVDQEIALFLRVLRVLPRQDQWQGRAARRLSTYCTMVEVCECARCFSIQISPQISIVVAMPHCHCHCHCHCHRDHVPAPSPSPSPSPAPALLHPLFSYFVAASPALFCLHPAVNSPLHGPATVT